MKSSIRFFILFVCILICSCTSVPNVSEKAEVNTIEETPAQASAPMSLPKSLIITFAGDIMAHTPNFKMNDYSLIYKDIETIIKNDDLSFANLETPVHSEREYESYPTFNVKPPYVEAAINAGFDVFSLANNHTNDQGSEGMIKTREYFEGKRKDGIYSAGIKAVGTTNLTYQLIEKNDWKILFVATTEILNSYANRSMIDFIAPNADRRKLFCQELKKLREENPCDIFILSIHTCEDEYVHAITDTRRNLYRKYIESGVDIIWANHPHLAKEWEIFTKDENSKPYALAMYALGNTISAQRTNPQFEKPETNRDYTGDGYLIQVKFEKLDENVAQQKQRTFEIAEVSPYLITTYINPNWQYVIQRLNDDFIQNLRDSNRTQWADYLSARKTLMENIHGKVVIE